MYTKTVLPNGVRILTEEIPYVRSVSLGFFIGSGSRGEKAAESGASHFIEHMVFKGTRTRSAADIAALSDEIGGQINAYTTKECTCFYGRVLDLHLPRLSDMLCDMLFDTKFADADVDSERGVIFEEIDMYEDTPEDLVAERLFSAIYAGSSLGRPILGRKSTLAKMDGAFLRAYMQRHYRPEEIVVAVSGSFRPADIQSLCDRFSAIPRRESAPLRPAVYTPAFITRKKSIEQNHLCLYFPGIPTGSEDRFAMQLLSSILGGGMSSRLFQGVREQRGLCYSIYSFTSSYADTGIFGIYTALSREAERKAISVILDQLRLLLDAGVSVEELNRAREQLKANVLMGLESTGARMSRLGKSELSLNTVLEPDTLIARYDAVTAEDVIRLAVSCLDLSRLSFAAVGKVAPKDEYRAVLEAL